MPLCFRPGWLLLACVFAAQPPAWAETYRYDVAGRLVEVVYDDGSSIQYAYDLNGNILQILPAGPAPPCGDVDGSGAVTEADAIALRARLAGVGTLPAPERCNVIGPSTSADLNGDGLRDDCDIADAVVLRRGLVGRGPAAGTDCGGGG